MESGQFSGKKSKYGKDANRLKQRLRRDEKQTYSITHKDPAKFQKRLLRQYKKAFNFDEQTLNWEALSGQFIDADKLRAFDGLNDFQLALFFKYVQWFFDMVEKRGIDCLWDPTVYCFASVPDWHDRLVFIAGVEEEQFSDNEDDSSDDDDFSPCLYRHNNKSRAHHATRKSSSGSLRRKSSPAEVYCSLISPHNTGGNEIYGQNYESAHFYCNTGRCLNPLHIKRQTIAENQREGRNRR